MDSIKERIEILLEELGFKKVNVNGNILYLYRGCYYKVTYIKGLKSFVIECASNYDEAQNNVFEDGDLYPISLGENALLDKLRSDLVKYYITG